jgi:hypothetical protein
VAARVVGDGCCKNLRMREISGGGRGRLQPKGNRGAARVKGGELVGSPPPDRDPRPNLFSRLFPTPAHKSNKNSTVLLVNAS